MVERTRTKREKAIGVGVIVVAVIMVVVETANFVLFERHQISRELNQVIREVIQFLIAIFIGCFAWQLWKKERKS